MVDATEQCSSTYSTVALMVLARVQRVEKCSSAMIEKIKILLQPTKLNH